MPDLVTCRFPRDRSRCGSIRKPGTLRSAFPLYGCVSGVSAEPGTGADRLRFRRRLTAGVRLRMQKGRCCSSFLELCGRKSGRRVRG